MGEQRVRHVAGFRPHGVNKVILLRAPTEEDLLVFVAAAARRTVGVPLAAAVEEVLAPSALLGVLSPPSICISEHYILAVLAADVAGKSVSEVPLIDQEDIDVAVL